MERRARSHEPRAWEKDMKNFSARRPPSRALLRLWASKGEKRKGLKRGYVRASQKSPCRTVLFSQGLY